MDKIESLENVILIVSALVSLSRKNRADHDDVETIVLKDLHSFSN
ncbi:MAG: hypothetical protein QXK54_07350 [Ignisphaera sp.]